ncbi:MAG: hypothetical protein GQ471_00810 [Nitrosopumilus sp.]|nr:hypothetical protein [Nitrosopumilus sp.]
MYNKNFPEFGNRQTGPHIETLKNYALPDFILKLVAKECDSDLLEKGRTNNKLQSMNQKAIELLYKIFVKCDEDSSEKYAKYRFYAYVSSSYHKCEILIDEMIPGISGKNYKIPVAVKENEMYIAIAFSKSTKRSVTKQEIKKFYNISDDLKQGEHGTQLIDSIYCSTSGFMGNALVELENLNKKRSKDPETKINFNLANFENEIFSSTRC